MSDMDSGRLLAHIDEAKNWLDKAKEEYKGSNRIRGDLHLNLAQAEVKCAWELSRRSDVTKIDALRQTDQPSWRQRYILPAAAVLLAGMMVGAALYWQWKQSSEMQSDSIAMETEVTETVKSESVVPTVQSQPVASSQVIPEAAVSHPVSVKSETAAVKTAKVEKPAESKVDEKREPSIETPRNPSENIVPVATHAIGGGRVESSSVAGKIQPVSSFVIDEEALTRKASKSLRLGK